MGQFLETLTQRYKYSETYLRHLDELLSDYNASGIAPPHLGQELSTADDGKLHAHAWEAILFRHIKSLGLELLPSLVTKAGQDGPDFGVVFAGKRIWIEAIVPSPEGIPADWLTPPEVGEVRLRSMPHEAMLLRWTSAVAAKKAKIDTYFTKGIVLPDDSVVTAINGCRLSDYSYDDHGVSRLPFAVEAVFPVGPLGIPISKDGKLDGEPRPILRYSLKKVNGSEVPTANFLNPEYRRIGGIVGCIQKHLIDSELRLTLVHNPLAVCPLPYNFLKATTEYSAVEDGEDYLLEELRL